MRSLLALLLLAACTSPGPPVMVERRASDTPAPRGEALFRQAMLDGHNRLRHGLGVAAMTWDATLAADAQRYADDLARTGRFEHSHVPRGTVPGGEGENLWKGTREAYRFEQMIGHWAAEKRFYNGRPVPESSSTGTFGDVAHYTQMAWRRSTRLGCAIAGNARDDYVVCRYAAPGNVVGQVAY